MMKTHPDQLLAELKGTTGKRAHKNLDLVHEVCREIFNSDDGGKDYSLAAVGRQTEKRGGPALNTLYAPLGKRFRAVIKCWAEWDGTRATKAPRPPTAANDHEEILRAIKDPVVCSLVGFRLAEARRWKAELDTIKANTQLVVDQRPRDGRAMGASARVSQIFGSSSDLLPTEREALEIVASEVWLTRNALAEGAAGEVLARNGAVVLPIGFLPAIRKIIGSDDTESLETRPPRSATPA